MNKLISVIIPSWNGKEFLKVCLSSLNKQSFKNFKTIVVDNGSVDQTVEYLKTYYPQVKIISLKNNYGFSKAVNEGIKSSKTKYIFLLNNDTEVKKDCLKILLEDIKNKNIGFAVPKIMNFYKRNILELAGNEFVIDSVGHLYSMCVGKTDSKKYNIEGYTFLAPGGAVLFKKEIFNKIGLFDESFFLYLEDADLSLRAQLAGFKGWYEPKAVVYHMGKASSKNISFVEPECFRNIIVTIIKNFPNKLLIHNFNWLKIILVNLNTIKYLARRGYLLEALKADWYILTHFKKLLRERKRIQKSKIVPDEYFIKNIKEKKVCLPVIKICF